MTISLAIVGHRQYVRSIRGIPIDIDSKYRDQFIRNNMHRFFRSPCILAVYLIRLIHIEHACIHLTGGYIDRFCRIIFRIRQRYSGCFRGNDSELQHVRLRWHTGIIAVAQPEIFSLRGRLALREKLVTEQEE